MEQNELLAHACRHLGSLGLDYLVTGSVATTVYGEPRFTNDIDVAIDLPLERVDEFCAGFPESDFYLSKPAVVAAIRQQRQFNVLHPTSGLKIDFMILTDSPFDLSRRQRARSLRVIAQVPTLFASPEDVILKKLTFYQLGGSDKHLRDISGVLRLQGPALDRDYIQDWAAQLGVSHIWQLVLDRVADA